MSYVSYCSYMLYNVSSLFFFIFRVNPSFLIFHFFFFFFKQKTAYEMRISDWSSDVCSSDLLKRVRSSRERESDKDILERQLLRRIDWLQVGFEGSERMRAFCFHRLSEKVSRACQY